jgi:hypothetical protein
LTLPARTCGVALAARYHHVDLPREQILHRRPAAAIGYELEAGAGRFLEEHAGDMGGAADAGSRLRCRALLRPQPGDELLEVVRRQALVGDDEQRLRRDQRHRLEVTDGIVRQRGDRRVQHMRRPAAEAQRVAVGRGARDPADADIAGGAAHVLDSHGLAERPAHPVRHDAADRVRRAAGGERHHHGDRARGVGLRARVAATGNERNGDQRDPHLTACPRLDSATRWAIG